MLNLTIPKFFRSAPAPVVKSKSTSVNRSRRAQLARRPSRIAALIADSSWAATMQNASVWAFYNRAQAISLESCGYTKPYQTRKQRANGVERSNLIAISFLLDQMSVEQYVKWYTRRMKLSVTARDAMSSADIIRDMLRHGEAQ